MKAASVVTHHRVSTEKTAEATCCATSAQTPHPASAAATPTTPPPAEAPSARRERLRKASCRRSRAI